MISKIFILGGNCSGISDFAKKLSYLTRIPYYPPESFLFKENGKKNEDNEIHARVEYVANSHSWIIETCQDNNWLLPAFEKADFVVFLIPNPISMMNRLAQRTIRKHINFFSPKKESIVGDVKESLNFIYDSFLYPQESFQSHKQWVKHYNKKYAVLRSNHDINRFLQFMKTNF